MRTRIRRLALVMLGLSISSCAQSPMATGSGAFLPTTAQADTRKAPTLETLLQAAREEFRTRDTNRDGFVSYREYVKAVGFEAQLTAKNAFEVANFNIASRGRDKDTKADPDEYNDVYVWNQAPEKSSSRLELKTQDEFRRGDADRNELLSREELHAFTRKLPQDLADRLVTMMDKRGARLLKPDGNLDGYEFHNLAIWTTVMGLHW